MSDGVIAVPVAASSHLLRAAAIAQRWKAIPCEIVIALAILALTLAMSNMAALPLSIPSGEAAAFVGIHYLVPLLGIALFGVIVAVFRRDALGSILLSALPAYAVVLWCHFNLKLWISHLNPVLWDPAYWHVDQALRPLVEACFAMRQAIAPVVPLDSNFYMTAFIMMFYLSFCIHALRDRREFRTLFLAALLFQALGAIAYLVAPALGPFVYENGVEPLTTGAQHSMYEAYRQNLVGGAAWIADQGGAHLTVGLAAMPSLHAGGAFLFLLFAWRSARVLLPIYLPLFAFILIDAVANRWHYLVDLPMGIALAAASVWLAVKLNSSATAADGCDVPTLARRHCKRSKRG